MRLGASAACLGLGLALVAELHRADGTPPGRRARGYPPGAGGDPGVVLDTAHAFGGPLPRAYARTLYGYDLSGDQATTPVPDIATGPPQVSADRRTYTRLRAGVRYAPPVNREVTAQDFITAIERLYDRESPSGGQQFANLIAGASAFWAGKATSISGLAAPDPGPSRSPQPAGDFLWILTLSFFAPVPEEYAAGYGVGRGYEGHVVGAGPYRLTTYIPGETVVLDRNPNWDPPPTPCAKPGWTGSRSSSASPRRRSSGDRREGRPRHQPRAPDTGGRAPGRPGAVPAAVGRADGKRAAPGPRDQPERRHHRRRPRPPRGQLRHRQAAYRDAIAGRFAPAGELASTILAPTLARPPLLRPVPDPGGRGDPAKAKALLAAAGHPRGLTLSFVTFGSGRLAAGNKAIKDSLARAGIRLKVKSFKPDELHEKSLAIPAKRLEHQLGHSGWSNGWPGTMPATRSNRNSTVVSATRSAATSASTTTRR